MKRRLVTARKLYERQRDELLYLFNVYKMKKIKKVF